MELKAEYSKAKEAEPSKESVKLPKLVITMYNGALENWLAKFAYLKELVEPRVRKGIDGLPFTSEGYQRAKHIRKTNYGQTSEIINAYVENILGLPDIAGANPAKIHDFCETLLYNVQSLEMLGKLSEYKALVRGILNKLPGIKVELIQGKPDWQMWDFTQLINALHAWKEIHPCGIIKPQDSRSPNQRSFHEQERNPNAPRGCVYCNEPTHRPSECTVV